MKPPEEYVKGEDAMDENMQTICGIIRSTVSAVEVGKMLGLNPDHGGRCRCFLHGGDHKNLKLYGPGRGYYCFVCHASGDVIHLVQEYSKCSFMDALQWINDAFGLHLDLNQGSFRNRRRRAEAYPRAGRTAEHA